MKILLLTDMPPCTNYTAGIFLNHLVDMLPAEKIVCYSILNPLLKPEIPSERQRLPMKIIDKPREDWGAVYTGRTLPLPLDSLVQESLAEVKLLPKITEDIASFAREHRAQAIWCTLEGQTMIRLARMVARATKSKLYTHIWDPPGWWMRQYKVNSIISSRVIWEYKKAIKQSAKCGVASWAMKDAYEKSFHTESIVLAAALDESMALSPAKLPSFANNEVQIGLAGQIYAHDAWDSLIAALDSVNWILHGLPVKIKVLGRELDPALQRPAIEFLGWHSQREAIDILSRMDILYVPYWFDSVFEEEARLAFPSKITTYLASGRPAFFHGPEYSSPGRLLQEHNAGICCFTTSPAEIVRQLNNLLASEKQYAEITSNGYDLFMEKLTFKTLRENLYKFLPVESATGLG